MFGFRRAGLGSRFTRSNRPSRKRLAVRAEVLEPRNMLAATPELVVDINQTTASSQATNFVTVGNEVYFIAPNASGGEAIWRTDGTASGTVAIEIPADGVTEVRNLVAGEDAVYFTAYTNQYGNEVWTSDGTVAGTRVVADLSPLGTSNPQALAFVGGRLYFESVGHPFWMSDGTAAGTVALEGRKYTGSTEADLAAAGGHVFFAGYDVNGPSVLRVSDTGSAVSAVLTSASHNGPYNPRSFTPLGDRMFFLADSEVWDFQPQLWMSDGTAAGTVPVAGAESFLDVHSLTAVSDRLFFSARANAAGNELWSTDANGADLAFVDVRPGFDSSDPQELTAAGNVLFFSAISTEAGRELWRSDGTAAGTYLVRDLTPGNHPLGHARWSDPQPLMAAGNRVFFYTNEEEASPQLWTSDGTEAGTQLLWTMDYTRYLGYSPSFAAIGNSLIYNFDEGMQGVEPWISDGSTAGTKLIKDVNSNTNSSNPQQFVARGDDIFFTADDGVHGNELWITDGASGGTRMVADIYPGRDSSFINGLTEFGGQVYFKARNTESDFELWISDGTAAGTYRVQDFVLGAQGSWPFYFGGVGSELFLLANDDQFRTFLATTDGTSAGTTIVKVMDERLYPSDGKSIGSLYFFAIDNPGEAPELWRSDGTTTGTFRIWSGPLLTEDWPRYERLYDLTDLNGIAMFRYADTLWRSDGTAAGTFVVEHGIVSNSLLDQDEDQLTLPIWRNSVVVVQHDFATRTSQIRTAGGATQGSTLVATLPAGVWIHDFAGVVDGKLVMLATSESGYEIWTSDGTAAGTVRAYETRIPFNDSITALDYTVGESGVTIIFGGESGVQLLCNWDAPTLGGENAPPATEYCQSFASRGVENIGGTLYFSASDAEHGYELWSQASMPTGDFDHSGVIDDVDIDLLQATVRAGGNDLAFDLTGDGFVNRDDVTRLVVDILKTSFGDANLDRVVDRRDVAVIAANLGRSGNATWQNGDFSGDARVGVRDLALVQANFAPAPAPLADAIVASVAADRALANRMDRDGARVTARRRQLPPQDEPHGATTASDVLSAGNAKKDISPARARTRTIARGR
jgi:ELWxxDGT repeat protein